MKKTLGGSLFVYNGVSQDYCLGEAINCLKEFCDEVAILDAGSTDETPDFVRSFEDKKTKVVCMHNDGWQMTHGKQKLSHFSNMAHVLLDTDYFINLQADEILHENSYAAVRRAIETEYEAFLCSRINLWGNSKYQLEVVQERKPVSTEVIRLAKRGYMSYDDAESLAAQCVPFFVKSIRIYHMGFIRSKFIHTHKIKHMMEKVFETSSDKKIDEMDGVFDPFVSFSKDDLVPIKEPLPKIIQKWAQERDELNGIII